MAFGRKVKLLIGKFDVGNITSENSRDLSSLDIAFTISRSVEWFDNEATITVFNPSPDTINFIMSDGNSVLLQAGYEDETVGTIFVGQIGYAEPKRNGKDVELTITCVPTRGAFYQLARLNISVDFAATRTMRSCLQELCDYAGIALRAGFDSNLDKPIGKPFTCNGTFRALASKFGYDILVPLFGFHLYFDNNEMIVVGKDEKTIKLERITLDYDSGLLEAHEIRNEAENKVNFSDDPAYYYFSGSEVEVKEKEKKPSKEIDRTRVVSFKALISPKYAPNVFVKIDGTRGDEYDSVRSLCIKGNFIITECEFNGSTDGGDFSVTCTASEASWGNE